MSDQKTNPPAIPVAPETLPDAERAGRMMEAVVSAGDLESLSGEQRARFYVALCQSLGLNPMARPFEYLKINGKLVLYARRECAEQLGRAYAVSTAIVDRKTEHDLCMVTVRATTPGGRHTEALGVVPIGGKRGEDLANALMKAESKAKRRAIFSLIGLGWLDRGGADDERVAVVADRFGNLAPVPPPAEAPRIPLEQGREIFFGDQEPPARDERGMTAADRMQAEIDSLSEELGEAGWVGDQGNTTPGPAEDAATGAAHVNTVLLDADQVPTHPEYKRAVEAVRLARVHGLDAPDVPAYFKPDQWTDMANSWETAARSARSRKPAR